jgi:hypothetical protein
MVYRKILFVLLIKTVMLHPGYYVGKLCLSTTEKSRVTEKIGLKPAVEAVSLMDKYTYITVK